MDEIEPHPAPPLPPTPATPAPWTEPHPEIPYQTKPPVRTERERAQQTEQPPVNANATPEARALLRFLYALSGKHTLTGQHNFPGQRTYSTDLAAAQTGKTPALYGTDWGFAAPESKDSAYVRDELVRELIERWHDGFVVTLCWHTARPTENEPVTFSECVQGHITDAEFDDLLTPGTAVYEHWCEQVDTIAGYLKMLADARVPVLWRPYHEINGDWFWWNGHRVGGGGNGDDGYKGSARLYRQIYDRFVGLHGLHNLLWVWNPDRPARADRQFVDYFPGLDHVDVFALDCYGAWEQSYYHDLDALSGGKPLVIGETTHPPTIETFQAQPAWAFYMKWAVDMPDEGSPAPIIADAALRALVHDPRALSREDPEYIAGMNVVRAECGMEPLGDL